MSHTPSLSKSNRPAPILPIALTFCLHSVVAASLWLLFRFDDTEIRQQVIGMLCYSLAFFGSVSFFYDRYPSMWVLPIHIIVLMLMPNILAFIPAFGYLTLLGLGLIGLSSLLLTLIRERRKFSITEYLLIIVIGVLMGIYYFFISQLQLFGHMFHDIGIYISSFYTHEDPLFHSAIIKMLQNFNVPSTGLDGTPRLIFYHTGIHQWLAANLHYLRGLPITLLGNSKDVLWVPTFSFSLSSSVFIASKSIRWLGALALAVVGHLIYCTANYSYWILHLVSESYLFSLPIFISFMPIGLVWLENYYLTDRGLFGGRLFKQIFCTSLAIILCWVAKMSTGLIMTCYLVCCLIVPRFWDNPRYWLKLIVPSSILISFILFLVKEFLLPRYNFKLFAFAKSLLAINALQISIFMISILFTLVLLKDETKLRKNISLLMSTVFLIGQVPGLIFDIGGNSAAFFSDPTIWLCYFFASSLILKRIQFKKFVVTLYPYNPSGTTSCIDLNSSLSAEFKLNSSLLKILYLTLITSIFVYTFFSLLNQFMSNSVLPIHTHVKQALSKENSPLSLDVLPEKSGSVFDKLSRFRQRFVLGKLAVMKQSELGRIQSIANQLGNDTKTTVIYLPPDSAFWDSKEMRLACWAQSFKIPAVIGMPMLNGVRSGVGECAFNEYYGMNSYTEDSRNRKLEKKELCQRAKKLGFSKVLEIDTDDYQLHSCNLE